MPALNFNIFVDKVESGKKRQTIRLKRKRLIKKGDKLYFYTRMMHKDCRKIGEAVCVGVLPIRIHLIDIFNDGTEVGLFVFIKKGINSITEIQKKKLALDDGFEGIKDFDDYFIKSCKMKPGDVVEADIIYWNRLVKVK